MLVRLENQPPDFCVFWWAPSYLSWKRVQSPPWHQGLLSRNCNEKVRLCWCEKINQCWNPRSVFMCACSWTSLKTPHAKGSDFFLHQNELAFQFHFLWAPRHRCTPRSPGRSLWVAMGRWSGETGPSKNCGLQKHHQGSNLEEALIFCGNMVWAGSQLQTAHIWLCNWFDFFRKYLSHTFSSKLI